MIKKSNYFGIQKLPPIRQKRINRWNLEFETVNIGIRIQNLIDKSWMWKRKLRLNR